ncbi:hypothetical protein [Nocardioides zeae]|uniref:hypothetical protein n=1 Tax=Nocardioides zeae TaxID=1457234 RepID=UPI0027D787DF|nr:hypothetical protein [Nocardioides zeae]
MYQVELDIFSGRPNPVWSLNAAEAAEFAQRLGDGTVPVVPVNVDSGQLGYRGYIMTATGHDADELRRQGKATTFRVHAHMAQAGYDLAAEEFLLGALERSDGVSEAEAGVLSEAVRWDLEESHPEVASAAAACSLLYTSWNDFSFWNGSRRPNNNCYNYAANYASNTFAQPGRQGGGTFTQMTAANIKAAMHRDGWRLDCIGGNLRVALVIWPGVDYHFYRQNLNGSTVRWCHKPGQTAARNTDNSGRYITNPQTCDRGNYTTWGGAHVFSNGVRSRTVR